MPVGPGTGTRVVAQTLQSQVFGGFGFLFCFSPSPGKLIYDPTTGSCRTGQTVEAHYITQT